MLHVRHPDVQPSPKLLCFGSYHHNSNHHDEAFNDERFGLDDNLSDSGLLVFRPIKMWNGVFDELAPPLPPLPGIATNAVYDLTEPLSIIHQAPWPTSIESIYSRTYNFIEPSSVHTPAPLPSSITNKHCMDFSTSIRSIINQFRISEFVVTIKSVYEASEALNTNTRKMFHGFCDEMARAVEARDSIEWPI